MEDLLKDLDQIIKDVSKNNNRDVLFCISNNGCLYYLNFDFYWCLQFKNYSDVVKCYKSEVGE